MSKKAKKAAKKSKPAKSVDSQTLEETAQNGIAAPVEESKIKRPRRNEFETRLEYLEATQTYYHTRARELRDIAHGMSASIEAEKIAAKKRADRAAGKAVASKAKVDKAVETLASLGLTVDQIAELIAKNGTN